MQNKFEQLRSVIIMVIASHSLKVYTPPRFTIHRAASVTLQHLSERLRFNTKR